MIEKIVFKNDIEDHQLSFISNLPAIENKGRMIEFKKGLNIIIGPNGSGKSSILNAIGDHLAANHSGYSCITEKWLRSQSFTTTSQSEDVKINDFIEITHDGQPILFGNPHRSLGMGKTGIDEEFYAQGIMEYMDVSSESSGEQSNRRIMPFLRFMTGESDFPDDVGTTMNLDSVNNHWNARIESAYKERFKGNIPKGQSTILLDEPESGLGLLNQLLLWENVLKNKEVTNRLQIIIVSHSQICLDIEGANYIELKDGYLEACRGLLKGNLSFEDAAGFASNILHKLNGIELSFLKKVNKESSLCLKSKSKSKAVDRLIKIGFVNIYVERTRKRGRGFLNYDEEYIYSITEKGAQYLINRQ